MLIAIEGPDCVGKTTLFKALLQLLDVCPISLVLGDDRVHYETFKQMYDPRQFYLSDRTVFVSERVYSQYHHRPTFDMPWVPELHILSLEATEMCLAQRASMSSHPQMDWHSLVALYDKEIASYGGWAARIRTMGTPNQTLAEALDHLTSWFGRLRFRPLDHR